MRKRFTMFIGAIAVSLVLCALFAACGKPAQRPEGEYSIVAADVAGGEIVVYVNGKEGTAAREGDGIRVALKAEKGYRYLENSFTVNGSASAFQFTMPGENVSLSVQFEKQIYTVTGAEYEFGTVTPSVTQAACGETFTVKVTPKNNACALRRRTLCMNDTILERSTRYEETVYTVTMPACDVVFRAEFERFISLAGSGTQGDPWLVASEADFAELASAVTQYPDAIRGAYFKMKNDVTIADETFAGIGSAGGDETKPESMSMTPFSGIFDGDGHTVMLALSGTTYVGLFRANTGTVKNLTVAGTVSGGSKNVGGVVGYNCGGTVENCVNKAVLSASGTSSYHYGGVVGYSYGGTIRDCTNLAALSLAGLHTVGGIVGCVSGDACIEDCVNGAQDDAQAGAVTGTFEIGGIAGRLSTADANGTVITGCINYASVTGSGKRIAGIAGTVVSKHKITSCNNYGAVISTQDSDSTDEGGVGGIAGGVYTVSITDCNNYASVTNENSYYTGGILGWTNSDGVMLTNCPNSGKSMGLRLVGGIAGSFGQSGNRPNSVIESCANSGTVKGTDSRVGGIAGMSYGAVVRSCTNSGSVYLNDAAATAVVGVSSGYLGQLVGYNTTAAYCFVEGGYYKGTAFTDTSASA